MNLEKIEKQVLLWEKAAIIVPIIVTAILAGLWLASVFSFETLFYITCGMYFITAIIWWWWTMTTMRYVVGILKSTNSGIHAVSGELRNIRKEMALDNSKDK